MSRISLALFLLFVLVVIEIEAQKCRRYETICIRGKGCRTRCIRRGRRDVSEVLQSAKEQEAASDLEELTKRFEKDVNEENNARDFDDDEDEDVDERSFSDDLDQAQAAYDDDNEMVAREIYDEAEEE